MKKHHIYLLVLFLFFYEGLTGQTFSGYIYDKEAHEPIANAAIYIDGTSYNTISGADGNFNMVVKTNVSSSLVISHIKYDKLILSVSSGQLPDTIYLQEKVTEVEEVIVAGELKEKYSREKKLKAFRDQFLGLTQGGKSSKISPVDKIVFSGNMGNQRVGDMFPLDYIPSNQINLSSMDLTPENTVFDHFRNQLDAYPQEKIHLHLDRDYFMPGERVWFKAYLTDAATHSAPGFSRYVYVELIDPANKLINRIMLRPENGMHYGHIFLPRTVPEGYYTIRAYTSYMCNTGDDYFFKKQIRIGSIPLEQSVAAGTNIKKPEEDYEVSFFPEGGHLLEGTLCKVAFKALYADGTSAEVSGTITDEEGKVQASLETLHAGMGFFGFAPEKGKVYHANCTDQNGKQKLFKLPEAQKEAYSLIVTRGRKGQLYIGRQKSGGGSEFPVSNLLIHCRGTVLYAGPWDSSKKNWAFSESEFPSGVIHILLLDKEMNPLSERLVFCRNEEQAQLSFLTNKENYSIRDQVTCELFVSDSDGMPLSGNYSVSVTDDKDQAIDYSVSILSTLLLTSELRGYIDSPEYYFQSKDEESIQLLDCLMLTHGWRRYNVPEVVKGKIEYPKKNIETGLAVSGRVTALLTGLPAKQSSVSLVTMSTGETFETIATESGHFMFNGIEFPDSTKFFLRSENAKGKTSVELYVDEKTFPPLRGLTFKSDMSGILPGKTNPTISGRERGTFIDKASERYKYDDEMRTIHLQDVEVVARQQNKDPKPYSVFSKLADVSIGLSAIQERNPATMLDVFSSVPGIIPKVGNDPNDITLLFTGSGAAAIYINDVYMNPDMGSPFSMISPHDIERIDVFKPGAGSGIYGLLGAEGVVSITTKQGPDPAESPKEAFHQKAITPLGYQRPAAFYSPRYDTQEKKFNINPDLRTTIFWKPDIVTGQDGKSSFDFYTSDFSTTYSVIIEGLTNDGRIIRDVKRIVVN